MTAKMLCERKSVVLKHVEIQHKTFVPYHGKPQGLGRQFGVSGNSNSYISTKRYQIRNNEVKRGYATISYSYAHCQVVNLFYNRLI